jgi:hypothetical protein
VLLRGQPGSRDAAIVANSTMRSIEVGSKIDWKFSPAVDRPTRMETKPPTTLSVKQS